MNKVYIKDQQDNKVLPYTHVSAVLDDEGNDLSSHLGAFEDEVRGLVETPHQEYVTVATYSALPASGSEDTIYRVSSWDGSANSGAGAVDVTVYSEYAWNGSDYVFLCVKSQIDEVFDITVYNSNTKYADLSAALGVNGVNIPESLRKGGMSVKYVQSSDNKYVQARLMADSFTADVTQWQGVDDEPTAGSNNLVKSVGINYSLGQVNGLIQGGYSSSDGSFNPSNTMRMSTIHLLYGCAFEVNVGYKITAICWFEDNGTFIEAKNTTLRDIAIDRGYLTISLGHDSNHPDGENSVVSLYERPFKWIVSDKNYKNKTDIDYKIDEKIENVDAINLYQGGLNTSTGDKVKDNTQRLYSSYITGNGVIELNDGYMIYYACFYNFDGSFASALYINSDKYHFTTDKYIRFMLKKSDGSVLEPTENIIKNFFFEDALGFIQGGYSGTDGSFSPTNVQRISTTKIKNGIKYTLATGYKVTVIDHFDENGTFISNKGTATDISIDRGYLCLSIGHNDNSLIYPNENPFSSIIYGSDYITSKVEETIGEVDKLNNHTNQLSIYKEAWSTITCSPIFFKICNTNGSTYNLNIVINTDFHYGLQYARIISQWTDNVINEAIKCFLCLGDMDWATSRPQKTLEIYNDHAKNVWEMFIANKYHKPQLITLGNHDLNVEAPVIQWTTKAQQKAAYITPMLQNYGNASIFVNGIVTDNNNEDGCYWYCDIETSVAKVRMIGLDVFDYPTPTINTDSIVTPDTPDIDYDNNWVYWYFSDYLNYPVSDVENRRDLGFSVNQLQFVINALSTIPAGYTAIVCGHTFENLRTDPSTISDTNQTYWVGDSGRALMDILKKFKAKSSGSYTLISPLSQSLSYDFTNVNSNEVFMLMGHWHNFQKMDYDGIKVFVLIATDGNMHKPVKIMSSKEACDILVMSNDGVDNAKTIRFARYGHVSKGTANPALDTDTTADENGFHYIDNPESIYD